MSSVGTAWEVGAIIGRNARGDFDILLTLLLKGIKCRKEFCWDCLNDYQAILHYDNSMHRRTCQFHTDNLPS